MKGKYLMHIMHDVILIMLMTHSEYYTLCDISNTHNTL